MLHTKVFHSVLDFLGSMSPPLVAYFRVFQNPVRDTFFLKLQYWSLIGPWLPSNARRVRWGDLVVAPATQILRNTTCRKISQLQLSERGDCEERQERQKTRTRVAVRVDSPPVASREFQYLNSSIKSMVSVMITAPFPSH